MTESTSTGRITVLGQGSSGVTPDAVQVTLSVQSVEADLASALAQLLTSMADLTAVLDAHEVPEAARQTTGFSLEPHWDSQQNQVNGFEGRQGVRVRLSQVDQLGPLVTAAAQAAGDRLQVGQIELVVSDPSAAATLARTAALTDARAKAEQWAAQAGRQVGELVQLTETMGGSTPVPIATRGKMMDLAAAAINPGSSSIEAQLQVEYALI